MAIKDEYKQDGNSRPFIFSIDSGKANFVVESGNLVCSKCGKAIPPREMFCIPCFGQEPSPRKRAPRVNPDKDGLFDEQVAELATGGDGYE